jgi:hypothetical protein
MWLIAIEQLKINSKKPVDPVKLKLFKIESIPF